MFDTGVSTAGAGGADAQVDACVAGLLGVSARCQVTENIARTRLVESVCGVAELRLAEAEDANEDPSDAMRALVCEVAAWLRLSQRVARPVVEIGSTLDRMPLTAVRFVCGGLDWARVQVLTSVLGKASDATIAALEFDAVAAAELRSPRSLRMNLWRSWMAYDRAEAAAAKAEAVASSRGVEVSQRGDGTSTLQAQLTGLEGAEAEKLIEEIAGTVCPRDPRSARQRRVDGLLALLHSEHALECECDLGEECAQFGVADAPPRRRGHLLQILIDVQTLLGLTSDPAVLPDGTPLDADVARVLAEDAQWQALLIELVDAVKTEADTTDTRDTDVAAATSATRGVPVPRLSVRGRLRRAAAVPTSTAPPSRPRLPDQPSASVRPYGPRAGGALTPVLGDAARAQAIAALLAAIARDPGLAVGQFPDGHGGMSAPPVDMSTDRVLTDRVLAYRPTAQLAAVVRMTYRTCTHPGCDVPSTHCELDHIVASDHRRPEQGGWTIESNLHPVCTAHHQLKTEKSWTVAMLAGGAVLWTSRTGLRSITLPQLGCPTPPRTRTRGRPRKEPNLDAPTWWERHMPAGAQGPTTADLRAAATEAARIRIRLLRRRFRRHREICRLRSNAEPPPY